MKIGIDIGGSHVAIGLINGNGKIIAKEDQDLNNDLRSKDYCKKLVNIFSVFQTGLIIL